MIDLDEFQIFFKKMGIWFEVGIPSLSDGSYRAGAFFTLNLNELRLYFSKEGTYMGMKSANSSFVDRGNIPQENLIIKNTDNGDKK